MGWTNMKSIMTGTAAIPVYNHQRRGDFLIRRYGIQTSSVPPLRKRLVGEPVIVLAEEALIVSQGQFEEIVHCEVDDHISGNHQEPSTSNALRYIAYSCGDTREKE
jgi:hypothetical protein